MKVLVINAGSSSLKYQLHGSGNRQGLGQGPVRAHRSSTANSPTSPRWRARTTIKAADVAMPTHSEAIQTVLNALVDPRERRHLLHEGDRCGGSPCGPRRRDLRLLRAHQRRGAWRPWRTAPPWLPCTTPPTSSASRPASKVLGDDVPHGGCVRHRLPPDHAASMPICTASPTSTMRTTRSAATASTAPPTAM